VAALPAPAIDRARSPRRSPRPSGQALRAWRSDPCQESTNGSLGPVARQQIVDLPCRQVQFRRRPSDHGPTRTVGEQDLVQGSRLTSSIYPGVVVHRASRAHKPEPLNALDH
jgi:hypothetical protein